MPANLVRQHYQRCALPASSWSRYLLDPTDTAGEPSDRPGPGLAWLPVDPTLCRINEPLPGSSGPNVEVQVGAWLLRRVGCGN